VPTPQTYAGLVASQKVEWGSSLDLSVSNGSIVRLNLGVAQEAGLTVRRFNIVASSSIGLSAAAYHTFKPFLTTIRDGAALTRYLGTSRATNAYQIAVDLPFRLHDEQTLNERLSKGTIVGVEITTTGTPAAARALIQAELIYAR
jgi:hypothetical protein